MRMLVLALAAAATLAACSDDGDLRKQQAEHLRDMCQSVAARSGSSTPHIDAIGDEDLRRFTIGDSTGPRRGVDLFAACTTE